MYSLSLQFTSLCSIPLVSSEYKVKRTFYHSSTLVPICHEYNSRNINVRTTSSFLEYLCERFVCFSQAWMYQDTGGDRVNMHKGCSCTCVVSMCVQYVYISIPRCIYIHQYVYISIPRCIYIYQSPDVYIYIRAVCIYINPHMSVHAKLFL